MSPTDAGGAARAARHELERLLDGAPGLAATLPAGFGDAVERFVELLLSANRRLNLTRIVRPEQVARDHLLDALSALALVDDVAQTVDLGSGGGVPAIPLALARPDMSITCVDSVRKKADALRDIATRLDLRNVSVVAARAEELGRRPDHRERYGAATARACAPLPVLAELALPLVATGGRLVAWKGPATEPDDEFVRGGIAAALVGGAAPGAVDTGLAALGGRRLIVIDKLRRTDARYPRRAGEPGRRPLA